MERRPPRPRRKGEPPCAPRAGAAPHPATLPPHEASRYEALAHELHDSVAQQLGFLAFQARRIESTLHDPGAAGPLLAELRTILARVQKQVRELITGARIGMKGHTLREAIADAVAEFSSRSSVIFELDNRLPDACLGAPSELQVLQIVREALANVVRHSHARHVRIELGHADGAMIRVAVEDDGIGLGHHPPSDRENHYGMTIMRERADAVGAMLSVETPGTGGTRVVLMLQYASGR